MTRPTVRVRTGSGAFRRLESSSPSSWTATDSFFSTVAAAAAEAVAPATLAVAKPTWPEVAPLVVALAESTLASMEPPLTFALPMPAMVPETVPPALTLALPLGY